jgi:uncharacterized protein YjbJ (UPF0337 family)
MKYCTKDRAEGSFPKGKVKEMAGKPIDDPTLEADGKDEAIAGRVQRRIGQLNRVFGRQ